MWGKGLLKGLWVTFKHFWGKKETFEYPEEKLEMTERFRGGHLLCDSKKCIGCKMCAMACPNHALKLEVSIDENKKRHIKQYDHNVGSCMYCDLCVEACPAAALQWDKDYATGTYFKSDLVYDCIKPAEKKEEVTPDA